VFAVWHVLSRNPLQRRVQQNLHSGGTRSHRRGRGIYKSQGVAPGLFWGAF
jgi:hypothetical protein